MPLWRECSQHKAAPSLLGLRLPLVAMLGSGKTAFPGDVEVPQGSFQSTPQNNCFKTGFAMECASMKKMVANSTKHTGNMSMLLHRLLLRIRVSVAFSHLKFIYIPVTLNYVKDRYSSRFIHRQITFNSKICKQVYTTRRNSSEMH